MNTLTNMIMGIPVEYQYLGRTSYPSAVRIMEEKIQELSSENSDKKIYWWGLEHDLVYTCGLTTLKEHILDDKIQTINSRRGGSVTVHNPGQLVFYFAFPLEILAGGLQSYIRFLEGAVIETLWDYKIRAFLIPPHTGVWTHQGKIAFVGLAVKKNIIYHGIAINLTNQLSDYQPIHSCGISLPVTKLENETDIYGKRVSLESKDILESFSYRLKNHLKERFTPKNGNEFRKYLIVKKESFTDSALAFTLGQLFFNERRYWEAHEAWEIFWREYQEGEFKRFLGGLIQLASALHKLTVKPNLKGAMSLFQKSLDKLKNNPYSKKYIDETNQSNEPFTLTEYITDTMRKISQMENLQPFTPYLLKSLVKPEGL